MGKQENGELFSDDLWIKNSTGVHYCPLVVRIFLLQLYNMTHIFNIKLYVFLISCAVDM